MNVDYLESKGNVSREPVGKSCLVCPIRSANIGGGRIYYRILLPHKCAPEEEFRWNPKVPLLVLTGPGQTGMSSVFGFGCKLMSLLGPRAHAHCLLWDRRNIGQSSVNYELSSGSNLVEEEADDLYKLLSRLDRLDSLFLFGMSSGARLSLLFQKRHPNLCRGIVLAPPTGGRTNNAIQVLCESYYEIYTRAAAEGGMRAVAALPFYKAKSEENRQRLLETEPQTFIRVLDKTCKFFKKFHDAPLIGMTEAEMRNCKVPVLVVHSGDTTDTLHLLADARIAAQMFPNSDSLVIARNLAELLPHLSNFINSWSYNRSRV